MLLVSLIKIYTKVILSSYKKLLSTDKRVKILKEMEHSLRHTVFILAYMYLLDEVPYLMRHSLYME